MFPILARKKTFRVIRLYYAFRRFDSGNSSTRKPLVSWTADIWNPNYWTPHQKKTWRRHGLVWMFLLHVLNGQVGGESNKIHMILRRTQRFELNLLAIQICLSSFQINPSNNRKEFFVDFHVKKEFPQTYRSVEPADGPWKNEVKTRTEKTVKQWKRFLDHV